MNKKKLAGITVGGIIVIIVVILLIHFQPWGLTSSEVLFSDNFSYEAGLWDTPSDEQRFYEDGWLHLISYSSNASSTGMRAQPQFTDFILEVETKLVGGTDQNWHMVLCRWQDKDNYYDFGITADGYYGTWKWVGGNQTTIVPATNSSYINQGVGAVNLIHIECIGSNLSLSVNGHLLVSVIDTTFTGGDIALAAYTREDTFTEIAFDNIVVSAP
jgi:hypothetical protein